MTKDPKRRKEWESENRVYVGMFLMKSTDADIITYLDGCKSKGESRQGTIKRCIRSAIASGSGSA